MSYQTTPSNANTTIREAYDYIIVGGGSAGAIVAARLSEDVTRSVLLIEAGHDPEFDIYIPGGPDRLQLTKFDWQYKVEDKRHGRVSFWPRGNVLGGCSMLNYMIMVRGNRGDYDGWEELGCEGWSYLDVLPYFKRLESFESKDIDKSLRGEEGPIYVASCEEWSSEITKRVVKATTQSGIPYNPDYNGETQEGFSFSQFNVKDFVRQGTANTYISMAEDRQNLDILTMAQVTKVNIENGQVVGVTYQKKYYSKLRELLGMSQPEPGPPTFVGCKREVIISAGAVGSPQLLMLSGIGNKIDLEEKGIECIVDLPGVGANLRDHLMVWDHYSISKPYSLNDQQTFELLDLARYLLWKSGPARGPPLEGTGFFRTREGLDRPDLQIHLVPGISSEKFWEKVNLRFDGEDHTPLPSNSGFMLLPTLLHPKSIGSIKLKSSDPFEHPIIDGNYLEHKDDMRTLVEGFKIIADIVKQEALSTIINGHIVDKSIISPQFSDEYYEEFIRKHHVTIYHPVGTCKMGLPTDPMSVCDPTLKVYGVKGLRIIDCSIMPTLVSGNTNAPAMMIGEKGSDLIKLDNLMPKL